MSAYPHMEPLRVPGSITVTMSPTVWTALAAILAFGAAIGWPWIMLEIVDVAANDDPGASARRRRLAVCSLVLVLALGASAVLWHQGICANVEAAQAAPVAQ